MLLVKTKLGASGIAGIGLFAAEFIPKGTPVWKFMPGFDQIISADAVAVLSDAGREQFLNYAYLNKQTGDYVLCFDDARFFNHADRPNTTESYAEDAVYGVDSAARDIQPGEELTTNYEGFDNAFEYKMTH